MQDRVLNEKAVYFKGTLIAKTRPARKVWIVQNHCKNHMKMKIFEYGRALRASICLENFHQNGARQRASMLGQV